MAILTNPITNFAIGDALTIDHLVTALPAPITFAELSIKQRMYDTTATIGTWTITTVSSGFGQITNPGVLQTDGTYTASVVFTLTGDPSGDTSDWTPGLPLWLSIKCTPGPYTSEVFQIVPLVGTLAGN